MSGFSGDGGRADGCCGEIWVAGEDVDAGAGSSDVATFSFIAVGDAMAFAGVGGGADELRVGAAGGERGGVADDAADGYAVAVAIHDAEFVGDGWREEGGEGWGGEKVGDVGMVHNGVERDCEEESTDGGEGLAAGNLGE